jgi:hypothetical protein
MDGRAVPDEQDRALDLAQEHAQETDHCLRIVGSLAHLQEQSPIRGDATDERSDAHVSVAPATRASAHVVPRSARPSATDKSPLRLPRRSSVLPPRLFFERGPAPLIPVCDGGFIPLGCSLNRVLPTPTGLTQ